MRHLITTFSTLRNQGCERKDFQPTIVNGWYWAPTGKRIPAPRRCSFCEWSNTGGLEERQPDNREQRQGGKEEACIGILNNVYNVSRSAATSLELQTNLREV